MKDTLQIALFQYEIEWQNPQTNLLKIETLLRGISDVDVVVLPEAFNTGFSMEAEKVAESMDGFSLTEARRLAREYNVVLCGSLFVREGNSIFNRFVWMEPSGQEYIYDKRHLFSLGNEHLHYSPGMRQVQIDYEGWRIMPSICYDVRFPVWLRNTQNYDLLLNVANWPAARTEIWQTLLRARAIENQCYVLACNRIGTDGAGVDHLGHSCAINARGEILAEGNSSEQMVRCTLSKTELHAFRQKFNTLVDADRFEMDVE